MRATSGVDTRISLGNEPLAVAPYENKIFVGGGQPLCCRPGLQRRPPLGPVPRQPQNLRGLAHATCLEIRTPAMI